jgi:hypothetical protein
VVYSKGHGRNLFEIKKFLPAKAILQNHATFTKITVKKLTVIFFCPRISARGVYQQNIERCIYGKV